jgi:cytochrome P450
MTTRKGGRDWHHDFDLDDPTYGDVFHEVAYELVAQCPVAHSQDGYYIISRYEDILTVLHDWRTFSSADGICSAIRYGRSQLLCRVCHGPRNYLQRPVAGARTSM